jgi:hypothetical protein
VVFAGEGALGAFLARDLVLFRREEFFPFLVVLPDLVFHGVALFVQEPPKKKNLTGFTGLKTRLTGFLKL